MPMTDDQRAILAEAGTTPDQTKRRRALAIYLSCTGDDQNEARALLARGYSLALQPSFHLVPCGDKMASEIDFAEAYEHLVRATNSFETITRDTLVAAVSTRPSCLVPLRMIYFRGVRSRKTVPAWR